MPIEHTGAPPEDFGALELPCGLREVSAVGDQSHLGIVLRIPHGTLVIQTPEALVMGTAWVHMLWRRLELLGLLHRDLRLAVHPGLSQALAQAAPLCQLLPFDEPPILTAWVAMTRVVVLGPAGPGGKRQLVALVRGAGDPELTWAPESTPRSDSADGKQPDVPAVDPELEAGDRVDELEGHLACIDADKPRAPGDDAGEGPRDDPF